MPCSAMILAGGHSRRMGGDKGLLRLQGRTLLARTAETLRSVSEDIQIVGRSTVPPDCPPVRLTADLVSGAGPLGGLHAALLGARHDPVICTACDYPFLSTAVLNLLLARAEGHDAAVLRVDAIPHTTQAVYARHLLPRIEAQLRKGCYRLRDLLVGLDVFWVEEAELRPIDPDLRSLLNVNTPEDWLRARSLIDRPAL